jgi:serine/threonine protein kinase
MGDPTAGSRTTAHSGTLAQWVASLAGEPEKTGTRIGPYTLLSKLGEGGFGTVWLAEQTEPITRRVALKVIKPGMDSTSVVARFGQERQTLAMMDHPNIARVFDAGTTAGLRPYFAMEYVPGETITDYCDKRELNIRDRLALMARVCEAVQHAHSKGVIHRDLKPTNVLVQLIDDQPTPKVIDFGIAKAIQRDASQREQFTLEGMLIGTPEYMSPEQAAGQLDLDTRTDVYALGVILYELLTGAPPFEARSLRAAGFSEIQRIIREVEPPRPSTRLGALGESREAIAKRRRTQVAPLERELRRELEWIPLKAMRKERERRYSTAHDMAADIRRYLEGRALAAGPESRLYRARKFVLRNRLAVGAAAAVAAAIIAGAAISIRFGISEHEARLAETEARQRAVYEGETTTAVNTYLVEGVLSSANPDEDGIGVTVETVLSRAADALDERLGARPEVEMRVAATLGRSLVRVGNPQRARKVLERARTLATGAAGRSPGVNDILNQIDEYLGEALYRQAEGAAAVQLLRDRLATLGSGPTPDPLVRANLLNELGGALKWSDPPDLDGANAAYAESLAIRTAHLPRDCPDVLWTRQNLALVQLKRAQQIPPEQAEARRAGFADVLSQIQAVLKDASASLGPEHSLTLAVRAEEARLLRYVGRLQDSEAAYVGTIAAMRRVLSIHHWRTLETLGNYSLLLRDLGKTEDEARILEEAIEGYRVLRGPTHRDTQKCAEWLANAHEKLGCAVCATRDLQRVYDDLVAAGDPGHRSRSLAGKIADICDRSGNSDMARVWRARSQQK